MQTGEGKGETGTNQGKDGIAVVPTPNPMIPTGRGPQPTTQTKTKEINPHPHPSHTGQQTLSITKTQVEAVVQAKSEEILMESHQLGTHMEYSKRLFTEKYTKATGGLQPPTQTKTKESNPHPHPSHTGEQTLSITKTQVGVVEQAKSEEILTELHQLGTYMAYSKRPFTEEYTKYCLK